VILYADGMTARASYPTDRGFARGLGLSALLHAAVAAALLLGLASDHAGGGATDLDIVSVSLETAADLPSAASQTVSADAQQPQPVPDMPGAEASSDAPTNSETRAIDRPPDPLLPSPAMDTALLATPPVLDKPEAPDARDQSLDASKRWADAGQVSAAPNVLPTLGGHGVGAASASRGDMDRFARDVALVVARKKPKGVGLRGAVTIEFTLSPAIGSLLKATVSKSSGSAKLDATALTAIEKATYPIPPVGMTATQLTYRVPFTFD
jgi:periplasmic protein TonB